MWIALHNILINSQKYKSLFLYLREKNEDTNFLHFIGYFWSEWLLSKKISLIFFFHLFGAWHVGRMYFMSLLGYNTLSSARFRKNRVSPPDYGIHYNWNGMSAFWNLNVVIPANPPFSGYAVTYQYARFFEI